MVTGKWAFRVGTGRLAEDGGKYEAGGLLPEIFSDERWSELGERLGLTPRQRQVARLICRGMGRLAIARRLGVSPATVRMHTEALFKALEIHDRIGIPVRLVLADRELP